MSQVVMDKMLRTTRRSKPSVMPVVMLLVVCVIYIASSSITFPTKLYDATRQATKPKAREFEQLRDGVKRFDRITTHPEPKLLWLTLTQNENSWGRNGHNPPRTFKDFLDVIQSTGMNFNEISLGMLTSSVTEYETLKSVTQEYDFARVTAFLHPGFNQQLNSSRANRHDGEIQTARRAEISKLRNYLLLKTLQEERHILWLDADVYRLDEGIVQKMIWHSEHRKDAGMITARCELGTTKNYDLNAWAGTRQGPRGWDLTDTEIANGEMKTQGQFHVEELIRGTTNDDLVPLDTVGATILYMRASLVFQGLNFPTQYTVGTRWGKDGWDGIESEGLCYRARGLEGGSCFVMGGTWSVEHTSQ